jgi:diguanylate cyclase (GGDEF)-like protein
MPSQHNAMPPLPTTVSPSALAEALLTLANSSGVAAALKGADSGQYVWANDAFLAMVGAGATGVLGASDADLLGPSAAASIRSSDAQALAADGPTRGEHHFERNGNRLDVRTLRVVLPSQDGKPHILSLWIDDSDSRRREAELQRAVAQIEQQQIAFENLRTQQPELGSRDRATGLLQREHFEDQLRREVDLSLREHREFALVLISIDPPDAICAALGPPARRRVVEAMGRLLRANTRAMDAPCRLSEDRFAVLLSGVGLATAHSRMEGLRRQCATQIVAHAGQQVSFTVSMGVASFPHTVDTLESLTQASETALMEAQRRGGNRVTLASIKLGSAAA